MSLPVVDSGLPRVVPVGSGGLTRDEADDIYVEQADATGYDDILTATLGVAKADATGYDDILTITDGVAKTEATGYDDILTITAAAAAYVPISGDLLQAQRNTLAYTDTTAKTLFTLPAGAVIVGFLINVSTLFNDSGTDLVDIGDGTTAERFVANYDVSSAGLAWQASADEAALVAETVVKGVYAGQNANANAGAMTITCLYII